MVQSLEPRWVLAGYAFVPNSADTVRNWDDPGQWQRLGGFPEDPSKPYPHLPGDSVVLYNPFYQGGVLPEVTFVIRESISLGRLWLNSDTTPYTITGAPDATITFDNPARPRAALAVNTPTIENHEYIHEIHTPIILNGPLELDVLQQGTPGATNLRIFGPISEVGGPRDVWKIGDGVVEFTSPSPADPSPNTYTGTTTVSAGQLLLNKLMPDTSVAAPDGAIVGNLVIEAAGTVKVLHGSQIAEFIGNNTNGPTQRVSVSGELDIGSSSVPGRGHNIHEAIGALESTENITPAERNLVIVDYGATLEVAGNASARFRGTITNHGQLVKSGDGEQTFVGDQLGFGGTRVEDGSLIVHGSWSGDLAVEPEASFGGDAEVASLTSRGGRIHPGAERRTTLRSTNDVIFAGGTELFIEIGGDTPSLNGHDQLYGMMNVNLGLDSQLNVRLAGGFQPRLGQTFEIVKGKTLTGRFANAANSGDRLPGTPFLIRYDENQVVLVYVGGPIIVAGTDSGGGPHVRVFDTFTNTERFSFFAYAADFTGGVRVAMGDVTGDGTADIMTAAGPGGGPHVRVFDGLTDQQVPGAIGSFFAYNAGFTGGVFLASADFNGDRRADIVTGADKGGGPHVRVFSGVDGSVLLDLMEHPKLDGGVRVATGDINGDGTPDIITAPGGGAFQAEVHVFDGISGQPIAGNVARILPYPGFIGGVYVASGDVDGDGRDDIITGAGAGGGPHVKAFSGVDGSLLASFFAYTAGFTGGVRVAASDLGDDGRIEILTAAGPGGGPHVRAFALEGLAEVTSFFAFDASFSGGVFVAGAVARAVDPVDATFASDSLSDSGTFEQAAGLEQTSSGPALMQLPSLAAELVPLEADHVDDLFSAAAEDSWSLPDESLLSDPAESGSTNAFWEELSEVGTVD